MDKLLGFAAFFALTIFCLSIGSWYLAGLGGFGMISLLPFVRSELSSLLENTRYEGFVPPHRSSFPRAQTIAFSFLMFPPVVVWRMITGGWLATIIPTIGFVALLVWFAFVMRSEGWLGEKAREKEPVDGLR